MSDHDQRWTDHYKNGEIGTKQGYPEMFVTRLLKSTFPVAGLKDQDYRGKKLLDLSCGYGRNLSLFRDLGFDISATEVSGDLVQELSEKFSDCEFRVGKAHQLPFSDDCFDGVVACNSCYYLPPEQVFSDNLREIQRVIKPGGWFIGSIMSSDHSLFKDVVIQPDGSLLILHDAQGLRSGSRMQSASSDKEVQEFLSPFFNEFKIGHIVEDFMGFHRSFFYFSCYRHIDE